MLNYVCIELIFDWNVVIHLRERDSWRHKIPPNNESNSKLKWRSLERNNIYPYDVELHCIAEEAPSGGWCVESRFGVSIFLYSKAKVGAIESLMIHHEIEITINDSRARAEAIEYEIILWIHQLYLQHINPWRFPSTKWTFYIKKTHIISLITSAFEHIDWTPFKVNPNSIIECRTLQIIIFLI